MRRLLLAAAVAGLATSAQAYELLKTEGGTPLRWRSSKFPLPYMLNNAGTPDVPLPEVQKALKASFQTWQDVPSASITFTFGGLTAQTSVAQDDNVNLVRWYETGFPYDKNSLAVTVTSFNDVSGDILDADIQMNGDNFSWSVGGTGAVFDLQNVFTHEIGHFFGLGHSPDPNATMFADASWTETKKRSLETDDIVGVSFLYPVPGVNFPGDVNGDSRVNGVDLVQLAIAFGSHKKEARYRKTADFDLNGVVDGADLAVIAQTFGTLY